MKFSRSESIHSGIALEAVVSIIVLIAIDHRLVVHAAPDAPAAATASKDIVDTAVAAGEEHAHRHVSPLSAPGASP